MTQETESRSQPGTFLDLLDTAEWDRLRPEMRHREFAPGETIVAHGTLEPEFLVLVAGHATVSATGPTGERRELGSLGPGDAIGDMSLLTGEPASADVIAGTSVSAFAISQERLAGLDSQRARLIEALATLLARRLRRANERLMAHYNARTHAVLCAAADLPALARLPGEVARVVASPVLVVAVGDAMTAAPAFAAMAAPKVTLQRLPAPQPGEVARLLHSVVHDYDQVLVVGDAAGFRHDGFAFTSTLRVARAGAPLAAADATHTVAIAPLAWTLPSLNSLSDSMRTPIDGVIPPEPSPPSPRDPAARLARLITGRRIGLALGAGAAKGFAHIGVLRAFEEMHIDIDIISGCSIGAAIAAGYAAGYSVDELAEIANKIAARAVRPTLPLHSFLSNRGIRAELERIAGDKRFEDLDMPLAICATDLFRRCEVTFTSGVVWPRILASTSIPGIYPALRGPDSYLVDGAVLNPVPSRQCRELGAGVVIGVRLTGKNTSPRDDLDANPARPLAPETILRCLEIMHNRLSELSKNEADVPLEVCLERGGLRDFDRSAEIIRAGYESAVTAAPELSAAIPYLVRP